MLSIFYLHFNTDACVHPYFPHRPVYNLYTLPSCPTPAVTLEGVIGWSVMRLCCILEANSGQAAREGGPWDAEAPGGVSDVAAGL